MADTSIREVRETIRRLASSLGEANSIMAELRTLLEAHPPASAPAADLMPISEVAITLGVSTQTVYNLIHGGKLPSLRVGNNFRVSRAALSAYIEASAWDGTLPARRGG